MDLGLKDKVYIVTGGASGIGEAITLELVAEGAIPVIADLSQEKASAMEGRIAQQGGQCLTVIKDLTEPENCAGIVRQAVEKYGRLDGLVNNAGINDGVGLESGNPEAFEKSLRVNLFHYYNMAHYSLPHLKKYKGAIVNIASKVALTGQGNTSGYAAGKGGQLGLTREWAAELLDSGVRVNAVLPAEVMTPLYKSWLSTFPDPEAKLQSIVSRIPLGKRMTEPSEIAATVVFLLSPRSGHTTGQWVMVDGGYVNLDRALT